MLQSIFSQINWLAVIVAGLVYFAVGAIWYAPPLFGKTWQRLHKLEMTEESKKKLPMMMGMTLVFNLITAAVLALLIYGLQAHGALPGLKIGLACGLGFGFTSIATNNVYTQRPLTLTLIDGGYPVVACALMGIVLAVWH
jgi:hypothetical protein